MTASLVPPALPPTALPPAALPPGVRFFETMRLWRRRVRFAGRHEARMATAVAAHGGRFDAGAWARALREAAATGPCGGALLRVERSESGAFAWTLRPLQPLPPVVRLCVASEVRIDPCDPLLLTKNTRRAPYDAAAAEAAARGCDDALLVSTRGALTETSRFTLFYRRDGRWYTPPAADGLLLGVLRGVLLERGCVAERSLSASDASAVEAWAVGNSARGLRPAVVALG